MHANLNHLEFCGHFRFPLVFRFLACPEYYNTRGYHFCCKS